MPSRPRRSEPAASRDRDIQRLRALVAHAPVCVHEVAPNGTILAMNPAGLELLGLDDLSQVVGQSLEVAVAPADLPKVRAALAEAIDGRTSHYTFELIGPEGGIPCSSWLHPLRDEDGVVTSALGMTQDISVGQEALDALSSSEVRYRQMFETNLAVKLIIDPDDGRIVEANDAACRFYGYPREELEGLRIADINILPDEEIQARMKEARAADRLSFEFQHRLASGEVRDVEVFSGPVDTPQGLRLFSIIHDVTDRRSAEEELRRSEQRYRQMFEANLAVKLISDPETGRIVEANEAACAFYGYTPEEFVGLPLERLNTLPRERILELAERVGRGEQRYFQFRHRLKSGEERDVELFSGPVDTAEGPRLYSIIHDITERKQAEERLLRSEERFGRAVRGISDGIWEWQVQEGELYWSPRFKELLGYRDDELEAREGLLWTIMHPDDVKPTMAAVRDHLAGDAPYDVHYRLKCKDGEWRWFRVRGTLEADDDGQPLIVSGILEDIHEQVAAEEAARARRARRERQGRAIMELASDPDLSGRDLESAFARLTETACEVLEVDRTSVIVMNEDRTRLVSRDLDVPVKGEHFSGVYHDCASLPRYLEAMREERVLAAEHPLEDPRLAEFPREFFTQRGMQSMMDVPLRRAGELVGVLRMSTTTAPRRWQDDEVQFGLDLAGVVLRLMVAAEAYEARRYQHELERQVLHAQKLESLGLMASGVAHDFNNLLVAILGNADLARAELDDGSRAHGLIGSVESAARRAADLCRQMLAYSGRGPLRMEVVDLGEVVQEMVKLMRASIDAHVEIRVEKPTSPLPVQADATQLRQVVMNLIVNAAEAMEDGGGRIDISFAHADVEAAESLGGLPVPESGRYLMLQVEDQGQGMKPSVLARLYDPFFSTKFTGRGLGMAAVLGIMRGHGGGIEVHTEPGAGSRFRIYLPPAEVPQDGAAAIDLADGESWVGAGEVLLVDDDETVRMLGSEMLDRLGFEVTVAVDGEQALELLAREPEGGWRLVVLDLTMPGMSGGEVLAGIRAAHPELPVLMSSGYAEEEVRSRLDQGALADFLPKPYTLSELRWAVRRLLGE
ncbi:MAG: PAS domain S-box protein [Planctomycetota bacterium]